MYLESLEYSEEESRDYNAKSKQVYFQTKLAFLRSHRGIRENKMHVLIAPTHGGKSTAVRSVIFDIITNNKNKKILIWLSEETMGEFKQEFSKAFPSHSALSNVAGLSEQSGDPNAIEIKKNIEEAIEMIDPDLVFIDNITTSKLYPSGNFSQQEKASSWLKRLSKKTTLFIIAHTNTAEFSNRFLNEMDIRGGKDLVNLTEFLYILQPITVGDTLRQFIMVKKNRGQNVDGKYYRLYYNKVLSIFDHDIQVDFEAIKEIFKQRNKLGDR